MNDPRISLWAASALCGAVSGFWIFASLCALRACYLLARTE